MKFSKRSKYLLFGLLLALNIIIRIPSVPHECTDDSYTIHILANSISLFGQAEWWLHPLSIGGFYPYSYASVVPFMLSGISQCTGIDLEWTIWLFSVVGGVFSMFAAYLMAGAIKDNDLFKFLVAFAYSLSPGILVHSTFAVSTRGLFTMLLPLFIYLLLKTRNYLRYIILTFVLFVLLLVTHHYIYFIIPIILVYVILLAFDKLKGRVKFVKIPTNYVNIAFIFCFLGMLLVPFFTRVFVTAGSRYDWINMLVIINIRWTGILFAFALGGFAYLSLKDNKKFEEWFLLLTLLCLAPLLYIKTYAHFFMAIFFCILVGVALINVAKAPKQKKKLAIAIIIISLLLAVSFSGFYQHYRTYKYGGHSDWYMRETTNAGALWIKDNVDEDKRLLGNGGGSTKLSRMFAASGGRPAFLTGGDTDALTYGFINESYIVMKKNSPLTTEFYWDNPYVEVAGRSIGGQLSWLSEESDIDGRHGKRIVNEFNLSYMIEDTDIHDPIIRSVQNKKNNIYNNGEIRIWPLY